MCLFMIMVTNGPERNLKTVNFGEDEDTVGFHSKEEYYTERWGSTTCEC